MSENEETEINPRETNTHFLIVCLFSDVLLYLYDDEKLQHTRSHPTYC